MVVVGGGSWCGGKKAGRLLFWEQSKQMRGEWGRDRLPAEGTSGLVAEDASTKVTRALLLYDLIPTIFHARKRDQLSNSACSQQVLSLLRICV